jgi:hypothetical protein
LICYLDDASALVERLKADDPEDRRALIVRPANLEDVFLRIAGSTLEGGA